MKTRLTADSKRCPRLRANRQVLRGLENALRAAKLESCAIDPEHQDAMRLYLTSWVVRPLEAAIAEMTRPPRAR